MSSENEDRENVPGKEEDEQDFFNEEELIREGMNVHVRDSQGRTPLHEAVQFCFDDNSICLCWLSGLIFMHGTWRGELLCICLTRMS